jgi:hypothetical protein
MVDAEAEEEPDCRKELIMRYEELRAQALEASDRPGWGLGWALFVRKGMATWLGAWRQHPSQGEPELDVSYRRIPETSQEQQREIVTVWTGMVMGQLPRRIACAP